MDRYSRYFYKKYERTANIRWIQLYYGLIFVPFVLWIVYGLVAAVTKNDAMFRHWLVTLILLMTTVCLIGLGLVFNSIYLDTRDNWKKKIRRDNP